MVDGENERASEGGEPPLLIVETMVMKGSRLGNKYYSLVVATVFEE